MSRKVKSQRQVVNVGLERVICYVRLHGAPDVPAAIDDYRYKQGWGAGANAARRRIMEWLTGTVSKGDPVPTRKDFVEGLVWSPGTPPDNDVPYAVRDDAGSLFFVNAGEKAQSKSMFEIIMHAKVWRNDA